MNTINAAAAASLLPLPPTMMIPPPRAVVTTPGPVVEASGPVDQVTWSPGLWWLLNRYEYLFDGLLPQYQQQAPVVIKETGDSDQQATTLESAQPHWDDSRLLNAPPAAATLPPPALSAPVLDPIQVSQPGVGTFVDLVA
ncbi:MAG: hypothetical protein VX527_01765 [Planctomycetota bacterium]|nr:hypothetical protein [Planctomycetota bacterium]